MKNKINKIPTEKNKTAYKRQQNLCVSLRKKKQNLSSITLQKWASQQIKILDFQRAISNKGFLENKDITFIEGDKIVTSERELAKTFSVFINFQKFSLY